MNIDWQAYQDGLMASAERARVDEMLRSDAAVRADRDAFQAFCGALRQEGMSESIPLDRLHARIPAQRVARRATKTVKLAFGLACCCLLGWAAVQYVSRDPYQVGGWIPRKSMQTATFAEAIPWVAQGADVKLPTLDLSSIRVHVTRAAYGSGWGRLEMTECGQNYTLTLSRDVDAKFIEIPGNGTYHDSAAGTGWLRGGLAFYVQGPLQSKRHLIADAINKAFPESGTCRP